MKISKCKSWSQKQKSNLVLISPNLADNIGWLAVNQNFVLASSWKSLFTTFTAMSHFFLHCYHLVGHIHDNLHINQDDDDQMLQEAKNLPVPKGTTLPDPYCKWYHIKIIIKFIFIIFIFIKIILMIIIIEIISFVAILTRPRACWPNISQAKHCHIYNYNQIIFIGIIIIIIFIHCYH